MQGELIKDIENKNITISDFIYKHYISNEKKQENKNNGK